MIPKIIHYCWLSAEVPDSLNRTIESWGTVLPDYDIIRWDFNRFPRGKSKWVDQAFDNRKYAFAADYIRIYSLYHYGGIYLDADVRVLKSYDDLLDLPYFVGQEKSEAGIEAATIGFSKGSIFLKQLLDRYENRSFVQEYGTFDMQPLPDIIRQYIESQVNYNVISSKEDFVFDDKHFNVFTADYFSPKNYLTGEIQVTGNTYSIHDFAGSWVKGIIPERPDKETLRQKIIKRLLLRRNILLLSSPGYARHFNKKFGISLKGPLWDAYLSKEDFNKLSETGRDVFFRDLVFIDCREARNFDPKDFHPVARIEGTDIELHFKKCITKAQARESWEKGAKEIAGKRIVFLDCKEEPSRSIDYLTCLLINLGKTVIRL